MDQWYFSDLTVSISKAKECRRIQMFPPKTWHVYFGPCRGSLVLVKTKFSSNPILLNPSSVIRRLGFLQQGATAHTIFKSAKSFFFGQEGNVSLFKYGIQLTMLCTSLEPHILNASIVFLALFCASQTNNKQTNKCCCTRAVRTVIRLRSFLFFLSFFFNWWY